MGPAVTFAPATLVALGAYWRKQGGVNLGIVGDAAHQKRPSYHNGQDVIAKHGRTALDDYTIRLARDREPHLTNAAAAIDLGKLDGKLSELYRFSNWLVAECLTDPDKRFDVREIIYSPDGRTVQRYSGPDNRVQVGGGDDSHLWHTHISFYRDSEKRTKLPLFSPFFLPDTDTGDDMPGLAIEHLSNAAGTVTVKGDGHYLIVVSKPATRHKLPNGERRVAVMKGSVATDAGDIKAGTVGYVVAGIVDGQDDAELGFLLEADVDADDAVLLNAKEA